MANEQGIASVAPMSALQVGTRLQEYVIRSVVGEGGFGIVYLAHDTMLDWEVAIKEYLPASLATRSASAQVEVRLADKRELFVKGMRRFVNEAHILARFKHPALVSVLRLMEGNGTAYMVMPFYRGKTLREMVRNGFRAKTTEDLFSLLLPVLDGLTQIHSVDCYHLDISSDNILILENGAPVLLDFGAARHTELSGEDPTTIILKPGFAPIEQYSNDDDELQLGPWTDIYAISAVAYLLVTGSMPTVSVARIMRDTVRPLESFATPTLPASVLKVVDAGLAVKPRGRPQNVKVYVQALLKAAEGRAPVRTQAPPSRTAPPDGRGAAPQVRQGAAPRQQHLHGASYGAPGENPVIMRWVILLVMLLLLAAVVLAVLSGNEDSGTGALPGPGETNMAVWQSGGDMALCLGEALDNSCPFGLGLPKSLVSWAMPFDKLRANGMAQNFPRIRADFRASEMVQNFPRIRVDFRASEMVQSFPRIRVDSPPFGLSLSKPVLPQAMFFGEIRADGLVQTFLKA
ncbi:MAG: serine/threonine protein kinase [Azoarcus sp.]|jgi:serine/threonine protein kinase|nr:serine/threonine protein kinase [Azoarcus sp.]